jgi:hypothetical protein
LSSFGGIPFDRYYHLEEQCTALLARTSFSWSAFNTFYPFRHQHYLHHQLKRKVWVIFEVSVALFVDSFSFVSNWV